MSVQGFNFGDGIVKYDYNHLDNAPIPEEMTVGSANQLISKLTETDKEPYLFRTAGGSLEIGDREKLKAVVGGSVGWNQLIDTVHATQTKNDVTATKDNNKVTFSGTATSLTGFEMNQSSSALVFQQNHVYYSPSGNNVKMYDGYMGDGQTIFKYNRASSTGYVYALIQSGVTVNETVTPQLFDLTLLLGSTIADYIYTLETATAGAGIAKLKSWGFFTKDYYPYDAGSLKSVEGLESHDLVGFNQWDEEWELGRYNVTTGEKISASTAIRCKNHIQVIPEAQYYVKAPVSAYFMGFDASGSCIGILYNDSAWTATKNKTITMPSNCHEVVFYCDDITTYNHDICINLSWDGERDGEYEAYEKRSYPLDSSLILRGVPKLDENNQLYYDGDTYESDGTVTRRYGIVDLGTLDWSYREDDYNIFYALLLVMKKLGNNAICSKYQIFTGRAEDIPDGSFTVNSSGWSSSAAYILIKDTSYSDATTFKTAMSGVYLVYELATPTTETADPFQSPQIVDNWGTEEFVTDSIVPVGHNTKYPANLRERIESIPVLPTTAGNYRLQVTIVSGKPVYEWVTT